MSSRGGGQAEDFFSSMEKIDPTYSKPISLNDIDYSWVRNCNDVRRMKQAVSLLENDGGYSDLTKTAQKKLRKLQKQSEPTSDYLKKVKEDVNKWREDSSKPSSAGSKGKNNRDIPPVRGTKRKGSRKRNSERLSKEKRAQLAEKEKIKGNEAFRARDYEEAVHYYSSAIEYDPENGIFYSNRSIANLKLKKYSDADSDATKAIELNPKNFKAFNRRGEARYNLKKFESALQDFTSADKLSPGNAQIQASLKKCRAEVAKQKKSSRKPKASGKSKPAKKSTRVKIVDTSESEEENVPEKAKTTSKKERDDDLPPLESDDLPKLEKRDPTPNKTEVKRPKITEIKQTEKASKSASNSTPKPQPKPTPDPQKLAEEKEFDRALIFARAESIKSEGNVMFKSGRLEEAISKYESALFAVKETLLERGDITQENAKDYDLTELGAPVCSKFHGNITLCYQQIENFKKSIHHSTKAYDVVCHRQSYRGISWKVLNALKIKALLRRSLAYERLGKQGFAYDDLMRAHQLDSSVAKIREKLPRLRRAAQAEMSNTAAQKKEEGNKLVSEKAYDEALKVYTEGLTALKFDNPSYVRPSDKAVVVSLLMNRALVFLNLKQYKEAASDCDLVLQHFDENNAKAYYRRALALKELGEYEAAKKDAIKTAELKPQTKEQSTKLVAQLDKLIAENPPKPEPVVLQPQEHESEVKSEAEVPKQTNESEVTPTEGVRAEVNESSTPQKDSDILNGGEATSNGEAKHVSEEDSSTKGAVQSEDAASIATRAPKNHFELMKVYNNLKSDSEKLYNYIKLISPSKLPDLFGDNLEQGVLETFISVIRKHGIRDSPGKCFSILKYLSMTNRFELNLMFLEDEQRQALKDVLDLLSKTEGFSEKEVRDLSEKYSI